MAKGKGSLSWLIALERLIEIIKKEYRDGGKLPPAPVMSKRLGVSPMTYGKALQTACLQGVVTALRGRGGVIVLPQKRQRYKIGILEHAGETCSFVQFPEFIGSLFTELHDHYMTMQNIHIPCTAKLSETLLIYNISALVCIDPPANLLGELKKLRMESKIPFVIVCETSHEVRNQCQKEGLPIILHDRDAWATSLSELMRKNHLRRLCHISSSLIADNLFLDHEQKGEFVFMDGKSLLFEEIAETLPKIACCDDLLMVEGGFMQIEEVCEILLNIPEEKRPAVCSRAMFLERLLDFEKYKAIRFLGIFTEDYERLGKFTASLIWNAVKTEQAIEQQVLDYNIFWVQ